MIKQNELIRAEKHALQGSLAAGADLTRMVVEYRKLVRALCGIVFVNLKEIKQAKSQCFAVEQLFHHTAANPNPKYAVIDRIFPKFPSYLRRAAIEAAVGAVSSFTSNYARWQSFVRTKRDARPPSFAQVLKLNPPLYAGQCIQLSEDYKTARIKVLFESGEWGWSSELAIKGRLKRLPTLEKDAMLSPTLLMQDGHAVLVCPVKQRKLRWTGGDIVCSVDLGINTGATCAVVDSVGTVRASKFLTCGRHNDQLDKLSTQIRHKANRTLGPVQHEKDGTNKGRPGQLSKGFCATLYNRIAGLNRSAAQQLASGIIAFAQQHGATSIVFEHLKGWRPKAPRLSMRHRFHRWLHRLVVKRAELLAQEKGMKVQFIAPRGTSAWAHDGSGEVTRQKENHSLCVFASGKRYNADLNAALNIASRFIARMLGITTGDRPAADFGKSSESASRMPIVLADIWCHAGADIRPGQKTS